MNSVVTVAPTWITSNYLQADTKKVIDGDALGNTTGNSSTPNATFTFPNAFTQIPNLGYGISGYQGTYKRTQATIIWDHRCLRLIELA